MCEQPFMNYNNLKASGVEKFETEDISLTTTIPNYIPIQYWLHRPYENNILYVVII